MATMRQKQVPSYVLEITETERSMLQSCIGKVSDSEAKEKLGMSGEEVETLYPFYKLLVKKGEK